MEEGSSARDGQSQQLTRHLGVGRLDFIAMSQPDEDPVETFEHLLKRVRDGDEQAITELVVSYEPEIRRVARNLLGPLLRPTLDTMDIAQSIQVALLCGMREAKFDITNQGELVGLVATMVRRKVADHWRIQKRRHELVNQAVEEGTLQAVEFAEDAVAEGQDPARATELNDLVEQILETLDEQEQRLLELRLAGCSTAEAAREMETSPDVLRVRLSRMRKKLRESGFDQEWL